VVYFETGEITGWVQGFERYPNGEIMLDAAGDPIPAYYRNPDGTFMLDADGEQIPILNQPVIGRQYTMVGQELAFEFSHHTSMHVNTLAKNVLTDKLFADLNRLISFIDNITLSNRQQVEAHFAGLGYADEELTRVVDTFLSDEIARVNAAVTNRINNMMASLTRHMESARRELTDLGSRGFRLELFQNRLETDEGSLHRLMSSNEDADMTYVLTRKATAEAMFMASLQTGTNIINMSLADFLQM
jgi:flagellin-like hook-associated protein FlgL